MTKAAYTIPELKNDGGPSRTKTYELIATGKLKARKLGRRTVILRRDWLAYLESLPEFHGQVSQPDSESDRHE